MSINPILRHTCSHCGHTGQGYFTFDNGWEFNCYMCSCVDKIPDKEIPPEVQMLKPRYSINVLKSGGAVARGSFPKFSNGGE